MLKNLALPAFVWVEIQTPDVDGGFEVPGVAGAASCLLHSRELFLERPDPGDLRGPAGTGSTEPQDHPVKLGYVRSTSGGSDLSLVAFRPKMRHYIERNRFAVEGVEPNRSAVRGPGTRPSS